MLHLVHYKIFCYLENVKKLAKKVETSLIVFFEKDYYVVYLFVYLFVSLPSK